CNSFNDWHNNGIPKLFVSLCVRNRNLEICGITHETRTFARCQAAWIFFCALRNKNLRTIFVIASAQGSRNFISILQAKTKTVSGGTMFGSVILQVFPQVVCKRVFFRHVFVQNGIELRAFRRELWKFKCALFLEADKEDSFAVLWHDAL